MFRTCQRHDLDLSLERALSLQEYLRTAPAPLIPSLGKVLRRSSSAIAPRRRPAEVAAGGRIRLGFLPGS